jgi:ABC-2 type transport system ATP-binding protein
MLQLQGIRKAYGARVVLDALDLQLRPGRTCGLWGRNGTGKTTLLRIISGMLLPDAGTVRVFGRDPASDWSVRRQMGIVEDGDTYFPELTPEEYLWWVGRLREVEEETCGRQIERLAKAFYIEDRLGDLTGSLSHGMRRKVAMASAFIGMPPSILLDEPTNGLDVDSAEALAELLIEHRQGGGTAVLACHDRGFVERCCSEVIAISGGRLVQQPSGPQSSLILVDHCQKR